MVATDNGDAEELYTRKRFHVLCRSLARSLVILYWWQQYTARRGV